MASRLWDLSANVPMPAGWRAASGLASSEALALEEEEEVLIHLPGTGEPQLSHAKLQCGSLHAKANGGTVPPAEDPIGFLEDSQDVLALGLFQGVVFLGDGGRRARFQVDERYFQHPPWR